MPSPILHLAAGAAICSFERRSVERNGWRFVLPVMAASILPDFDVLPGLLIGDPNRFHSTYSHSVGFAAVAAALSALLIKTQRWRVAFWVFVSWTTHCLLDGLMVDGRLPYSVPLFWPFSSSCFYAPQPFLGSVRHGSDGATLQEFFVDVFSLANLQTMLKEMFTATLIIFICYCLGRLVERRSQQ